MSYWFDGSVRLGLVSLDSHRRFFTPIHAEPMPDSNSPENYSPDVHANAYFETCHGSFDIISDDLGYRTYENVDALALSDDIYLSGKEGIGEEYPPAQEMARSDRCGWAGIHSSEDSYESGLSRRPPIPIKPLKMAFIGPNFQIGGVRQHALSLAKFLDPRRLRVTSFIATDPLPNDAAGAAFPAPYVHGDREAIERATQENDVLLLWGGGFRGALKSDRAIRLYVAHGESGWTRSGLVESAEVIDHVIAVSDRVRQKVCQGFPTTTILNGVDAARLAATDHRRRFRSRFAFGPGDFVLGSVGRFTSEKRHEILIESVAMLPTEFKLLLVGSGRRYGELCELANRMIPGRFAICTAHEYLGDYYHAMDAFALVSEHEGFGLVLAEAMMCGRPVIATDVGCVPEVVCDRVSGIVVEPTPESVAKAVLALQANPLWARGMAAQGNDVARRRLHAREMARKYEDLLLTLSNRRQPSRTEGRS